MSENEEPVAELATADAETSLRLIHLFRRAAMHRALQWDAEFEIEGILKRVTGDDDAEIDSDFGLLASVIDAPLPTDPDPDEVVPLTFEDIQGELEEIVLLTDPGDLQMPKTWTVILNEENPDSENPVGFSTSVQAVTPEEAIGVALEDMRESPGWAGVDGEKLMPGEVILVMDVFPGEMNSVISHEYWKITDTGVEPT